MRRATLPLHWGRDGLPAQPRQLLLVQLSAMGDQVQTLPAVSDIAARWPGLAIDWAVDARFAEIPRMHPAVRRVFALPLKALQRQPASASLWRELLSQLRRLRASRYDLVWDPHSVLKSSLVARLAHAPLRVGYRAEDCGGEPSAARAYHAHFARPPGVHGTEGRRAFAAAVLETDVHRYVEYRLAQALHVDPGASGEVLLAHGVSRVHREWAQDNWIELARRLHARGIGLRMTWGNERERQRAAAIAAALPPGASRIDPPPQGLEALLRYIAGARVVVGLDTGFTHFAAALRRPLLGVFSAATSAAVLLEEDPTITRTVGGDGHEPGVDEAWSALQELLDREAPLPGAGAGP